MPDGSQRTLADAVPFREVYIHALVRDADRQKMSKTKGNVIDPIDIIHRYGTDAVRFTLASMASPGTDIAFSEARTEGYRAFANKIWNAARFIFMQMDRAKEAGIEVDLQHLDSALELTGAPLEARWIVSRLNQYALIVSLALKNYRFDDAADAIYGFFWGEFNRKDAEQPGGGDLLGGGGEFCGWYLEIVKAQLDFSKNANEAAAALATLIGVFESALRLLAPFMPFLTEEIWHALFKGKPPSKSIALVEYPSRSNIDSAAIIHILSLQDIVTSVRIRRKELNVEEKAIVPIKLIEKKVSIRDHRGGWVDCNIDKKFVTDNLKLIQRLARVSEVQVVKQEDASLGGEYASLAWYVAGRTTIFVDYEKPIDIPAERERLTKDLAKYEKEMQSKQSQLQNDGFLAKAPAKIVDGLRSRADELTVLIEKTRAALESIDTVESR
jgi:valyl-tRNA synthetase